MPRIVALGVEINGVFEGGGVRAVEMSAAVPFLCAPMPPRDTLTGEKILDSDSATAAHYLIGAIEKDRPVIGFRRSPERDRHLHQSIRGPYGLAKAVIVSGIRARYSLPRTIEGAHEVNSVLVQDDLEFDVTPRQARTAFAMACASVHDQLAPVVAA